MEYSYSLEVSEATAPLLSVMVAIPALVAVVLWLFPSLRTYGRQIALSTSLVELALAVVIAVLFDWSKAGIYQWVESYQWISPLGVSWSLGVSALSLVMILLAAVLVPLVLIGTPRTGSPRHDGGYAALVLGLYAFIVLVFSAFDVVLFYFAFEAMLIPLYFMIGRYGNGEGKRRAALKFLIYSLVGGLVMLGGLVAIFGSVSNVTPTLFRFDTLMNILPSAPAGLQIAIFITFFVAFAIKAPMVPVHTWLPDTAAHARPGTSVLLVGVLDKIGTYGMIVFCLNFVPSAAYQARWVVLVLAVVSILWGGFAANGQKNLLRLVSFTSVSHFGFMVLGIFIGSEIALTGAMFYMVAHGLSIAGLFLISGFLIERGQSAQIADYGGMQRITPVLAGTWLFTGLASIALPGLSGFVPEYLVLMGTYRVSVPLAIVAVFGVVLAAMYVLLPYQRMFTGPKNLRHTGTPDLTGREKLVVAPLLVGMVVLGIWTSPLVAPLTQISESNPYTVGSEMMNSASLEEGN